MYAFRAAFSIASFVVGFLILAYGLFGPFNAIQGTQVEIIALGFFLAAIYLKPETPHDG